MEKKILIAVIVGGVVLLALVCLLIGALSGQMPWDKSKEYEYNPTESVETIDPDGPQPTEDTTVPTEEATEESTVPPTTQATLPEEDKVDVEIEVQLPTTAPTQPTDPTTGTEATTPGTEATTPTTEPSESTQPTEKDTSQVEDKENEQVGDKGFWDIFEKDN